MCSSDELHAGTVRVRRKPLGATSLLSQVLSLSAVLEAFKIMVEERRPMNHMCVWIKGVYDVFMKGRTMSASAMRAKIRRFLLLWSTVSSKILRQVEDKCSRRVISTRGQRSTSS